MYRPKDFIESSPQVIKKLMQDNPFATLVTATPDGPFVNHLPTILEESETGQLTIVGHMARANPQWRHFENNAEALVIYHGPHVYISPDWYEDSYIPTWNYSVVHARGPVTLLESPDDLNWILEKTIDVFEPGPPKPWRKMLSEASRNSKLKAIVGFSVPVKQLEAKFKISQNRTETDIRGVLQGLSTQSDDMSRKMREMMLQHYGFRHDKIGEVP